MHRYDTAVRVLDEKYYGSTQALVQELAGLKARHDARFWVAGRREDAGKPFGSESGTFARDVLRYLTAKDLPVLPLPGGAQGIESSSMFVDLPGWQRMDVSSSALRASKI